ncbi:MAG: beta-glucanase (GH16 family) [Dokdonia sp.]|jgi:beta-glucanase (GH16 family)
MKNVCLFIFGILVLSACQEQERILIWSDEFDADTLNTAAWNYELGDGCPNLCGWGNNEPQIYTKENAVVSEGTLKIHARLADRVYTSSRITTAQKKEFQYGYIESRIKLPSGKGLWPAFWMLGSDIKKNPWPAAGEIDIMEWVGRDADSLFTSLHTPASYGKTINTKKTLLEDPVSWHVYACDWNEDRIIFYRDDVEVYRFNPEVKDAQVYPFRKPFYILFNMAIGGNFGGAIDDAIFPQTLEVDYVRVYE